MFFSLSGTFAAPGPEARACSVAISFARIAWAKSLEEADSTGLFINAANRAYGQIAAATRPAQSERMARLFLGLRQLYINGLVLAGVIRYEVLFRAKPCSARSVIKSANPAQSGSCPANKRK